jgi:hypothetical protein
VDGINIVVTAFKNFGSFLADLGRSIAEWFKDPTKGFKMPEWKGLLEGFKATADKMPELMKPVWTDMSDEMNALFDQIDKRDAAHTKHRFKLAEAAEKEAAKAAPGAFKSETMGVAEYLSKLQTSVYSDKDDSAKTTAKNTERTAKAAEETARNTKEPKPARLG